MTDRTAGPRPRARAALATLAASLVLAGGAGLLSAPPAAAAQPCVGVIVDARLLGGGVRTGCAEGDPGSGLEALTGAGFRYAFVPRQPGLVCQVDGLPECTRTTTTTYWSYWYRPKGSDRWVYAAQGAGAHDPAPGSTEAWVWQDGGRRPPPDLGLRTICPQTASPAPRRSAGAKTSEPARETESAAPPAGGTSATRGEEKQSTGRRTSDTAGRTPPPATTAATSPPTATTAPDPASAAPTTSSVPAAPTTAPVAQRSDSSAGGPPWAGLAVGAALVAALATAAVLRGRRTGGPP